MSHNPIAAADLSEQADTQTEERVDMATPPEAVSAEALIEEVSIDGMCGVY